MEERNTDYANLTTRFLAHFLNLIPILLLSGTMFIMDTQGMYILSSYSNTAKGIATLIIFWPYLIYIMFAEAGKHQATWGMRRLHIYVVDGETGKKIGYLAAFFRFIINALLLKFYVGIIGYIYAGFFSKEKATFHDVVTDTRVVRGRL